MVFSQRRRRRRRRIRDHRFQHIHTPGCPYAAHGGKCVGWLRGRVHRCEVLERTPAHARRRTCYTSVVYTSLSIYICVCVCIYMYLSYSVFLLFPSLYRVLFSTRSRTTGWVALLVHSHRSTLFTVAAHTPVLSNLHRSVELSRLSRLSRAST